MPAAGTPFGNYTLLRRIARGGMAEVFLATQRGLENFERTVAIKRILPHLADAPQFVDMFMDEARLAARLSHPNIAHIYEFGQVDGAYFIAMEFIDGIDLSTIVLQGLNKPIPYEHAARVIAEVCAALNYAHQLRGSDGRPLNLVHRDISPQNILVSFDGAVKVVDFGIAKAAFHISRTQPGVVRGKYTYMAPEQVEGKPLDGRTDMFCAGIVLYELCTADALFPRTDAVKAMRQIRSGQIPPPRRAGQQIPPMLEKVIFRALAKRPEDRYANAAEMQLALEEYLRSSTFISNSVMLSKYVSQNYLPADRQVENASPSDRTQRIASDQSNVPLDNSDTSLEALVSAAPQPAPRAAAAGVISAAEDAATVVDSRTPTSGQTVSVIFHQGTADAPPTHAPRPSKTQRVVDRSALIITITLALLALLGGLIGYWLAAPNSPARSVARPNEKSLKPPVLTQSVPTSAAAPKFVSPVKITLESTPKGAWVEVDGLPLAGQTPTNYQVRPGKHTFVWKLDGYRNAEKTLLIASNAQPQVISAKLERVKKAKRKKRSRR